MALIFCPTCNNQISSEAQACPSCGLPLKTTTTIQQTNQEIKTIQLLSVVGFFIGFFLMFFSVAIGAVICSICLVGYLYAKMQAWWKNG